MKGTIVLLICGCLYGCTSWFIADCVGESCNKTPVATDPDGEATWYCYSNAATDEWSCQDERDPSRTLSLKQVGLKKTVLWPSMSSPSRKPRAPGPHHQQAKQVRPSAKSPQQSVQPQQAVRQIIQPRQAVTQVIQPRRAVSQVRPPQPYQPATRQPQWEARARPDSGLPTQAPSPRRSESGPGATSILQQPSGFYAVQLIALQDEKSILQYARDTGLTYPLYAQIQSKGRTMYVLLLGCYPDRLSAVHAKEDWSRSKSLSVRPWVRQVGPLQDAIRLAVR